MASGGASWRPAPVVPRQCSHSATTCTHDRRKYHAAKRFAERRRRVQFPPLTPSRFRPCLDGRHSAPLDRRATERRRLPSISRRRFGHIDRSHSLRWASPRSQCVYLCRSRTPEPTLRPDRWFLSVCHSSQISQELDGGREVALVDPGVTREGIFFLWVEDDVQVGKLNHAWRGNLE